MSTVFALWVSFENWWGEGRGADLHKTNADPSSRNGFLWSESNAPTTLEKHVGGSRLCVKSVSVFRFSMEKMLARLLMVREVQEHMLADQA